MAWLCLDGSVCFSLKDLVKNSRTESPFTSVMSMTFGRPAMISKVSSGAVPLPTVIDDEFISEHTAAEPMQPTRQPSYLAFYGKTLELYEIMNDVLLSLYRPISDDSADDIHEFYFSKTHKEGEHTIFELDHSLTLWARSLPAHLRLGSAPERDNPVFFRQGIVLNARSVRKALK